MYERAFAKLVGNPTQGHLEWTPEEGDAYRRVAEVQTEQRAMSTTDSAGGYIIPLTLDPAAEGKSSLSANRGQTAPTVAGSRVSLWWWLDVGAAVGCGGGPAIIVVAAGTRLSEGLQEDVECECVGRGGGVVGVVAAIGCGG